MHNVRSSPVGTGILNGPFPTEFRRTPLCAHTPSGHSERRLSCFPKRVSLTNGERPAKNLVASKRKVSRFFVGLRAVETEKDILQQRRLHSE